LFAARPPHSIRCRVAALRPHGNGDLEHALARCIGTVQIQVHLHRACPAAYTEPGEWTLVLVKVKASRPSQANPDPSWNAFEQFAADILDEAAQLVSRDRLRHPGFEDVNDLMRIKSAIGDGRSSLRLGSFRFGCSVGN